jgi:hypothetical protein
MSPYPMVSVVATRSQTASWKFMDTQVVLDGTSGMKNTWLAFPAADARSARIAELLMLVPEAVDAERAAPPGEDVDESAPLSATTHCMRRSKKSLRCNKGAEGGTVARVRWKML